jgi:hypothetical protein
MFMDYHEQKQLDEPFGATGVDLLRYEARAVTLDVYLLDLKEQLARQEDFKMFVAYAAGAYARLDTDGNLNLEIGAAFIRGASVALRAVDQLMPAGTVAAMTDFSLSDADMAGPTTADRATYAMALTQVADAGMAMAPQYHQLLSEWMHRLVPGQPVASQIAVRRGFGFVMYVADWTRRQQLMSDFVRFGQQAQQAVDWDAELDKLISE